MRKKRKKKKTYSRSTKIGEGKGVNDERDGKDVALV